MTDEIVCTFTANVNCLSCRTALLASWRAEDKLARDVEKLFQKFRAKHVEHPGFREGPPGVGLHKEEEVPPAGRTVVNQVVCDVNPELAGHLVFSSPTNTCYYNA